MSRKIFVTDLDGTLLTDDKRVGEKTRQALSFFVSKGNSFAISTGRDINSARSVYDSLGLDLPGSFVLAYNGGQIYDVWQDRTVYRRGLDRDLAREIFKTGKEYGIHLQTYSDDFVLSSECDECLSYYRRVIKTPMLVADDIFAYLDVDPCKILAIELHDSEKLENFKILLENSFGESIVTVYSSRYYLEILPPGAGKGSGIQRLSLITGVPKENIFAAGDEKNDISMLMAAGIGIAMKNGNDEAKKIADYITAEDNNNDGLADFLLSHA